MTIKNSDASDVSRMDLDRVRPAQSGKPDNSPATSGSTPTGDSIALSTANDFVQRALTSQDSARSNRVQELKNLIDSNQYNVDSRVLSSALIDAHLAGE